MQQRINNNKKYSSRPGQSSNRRASTFSKNRGPQRSGRKKSTLNPSLLVRKATNIEVKTYSSERQFGGLPISQNLKECLYKKGFSQPTEIQDRTLKSCYKDVTYWE